MHKNKKLFSANCEKVQLSSFVLTSINLRADSSSLNYQPEYNWTNQWQMRRKRCQPGSEFSCNKNRNLLAGLLMISAAGWMQQFPEFH